MTNKKRDLVKEALAISARDQECILAKQGEAVISETRKHYVLPDEIDDILDAVEKCASTENMATAEGWPRKKVRVRPSKQYFSGTRTTGKVPAKEKR